MSQSSCGEHERAHSASAREQRNLTSLLCKEMISVGQNCYSLKELPHESCSIEQGGASEAGQCFRSGQGAKIQQFISAAF